MSVRKHIPYFHVGAVKGCNGRHLHNIEPDHRCTIVISTTDSGIQFCSHVRLENLFAHQMSFISFLSFLGSIITIPDGFSGVTAESRDKRKCMLHGVLHLVPLLFMKFHTILELQSAEKTERVCTGQCMIHSSRFTLSVFSLADMLTTQGRSTISAWPPSCFPTAPSCLYLVKAIRRAGHMPPWGSNTGTFFFPWQRLWWWCCWRAFPCWEARCTTFIPTTPCLARTSRITSQAPCNAKGAPSVPAPGR